MAFSNIASKINDGHHSCDALLNTFVSLHPQSHQKLPSLSVCILDSMFACNCNLNMQVNKQLHICRLQMLSLKKDWCKYQEKITIPLDMLQPNQEKCNQYFTKTNKNV